MYILHAENTITVPGKPVVLMRPHARDQMPGVIIKHQHWSPLRWYRHTNDTPAWTNVVQRICSTAQRKYVMRGIVVFLVSIKKTHQTFCWVFIPFSSLSLYFFEPEKYGSEHLFTHAYQRAHWQDIRQEKGGCPGDREVSRPHPVAMAMLIATVDLCVKTKTPTNESRR